MSNSIGQNERLNGNLIQELYKRHGPLIVNQICKYIYFYRYRRLVLIEESIDAITNINGRTKLNIKTFLNYFISLIDVDYLIVEFKRKTEKSELYFTYIKELKKNGTFDENDFNNEAILCMLNTAVHNFLQSYNILNSITANDIILIDGQNFIGNILTRSAHCGKIIDLFEDFLKLLKGNTTTLNQQNFLRDLKTYNIINNERKQIYKKSELNLFDARYENEKFLTPVLNELDIFNKSVTIKKKDGSEYTRKLYSIPSIKPFFNNLILKLITQILSTDETKVVCFGLRDIDTDIDRFRFDKKYIYETESNSYIAYSEGMGFNRRENEDGIDYATWAYGHDSTDDFCLLLTSKYLTYIGKLNSVLSNDNYGWLIRERPCRTFLNNITKINEFANFELESSEFKSIIDFPNLDNIDEIKILFNIHNETYKIKLPNITPSYNNFAVIGRKPSILCSPISISDDIYRKFCQNEISLPTVPKLPKLSTTPAQATSTAWSSPIQTTTTPAQVLHKSPTQATPKSPTSLSSPKQTTIATSTTWTPARDRQGNLFKGPDGRADKEDDWRRPSSTKSRR